MKKLLGIVVLGLFLGGCATAPVVVDQINSVDPNYYKKKYFDGKELSKVEGIWRWMNGNYKVAIIKNDLGVEPTFEYLGILKGQNAEKHSAKIYSTTNDAEASYAQ